MPRLLMLKKNCFPSFMCVDIGGALIKTKFLIYCLLYLYVYRGLGKHNIKKFEGNRQNITATFLKALGSHIK